MKKKIIVLLLCLGMVIPNTLVYAADAVPEGKNVQKGENEKIQGNLEFSENGEAVELEDQEETMSSADQEEAILPEEQEEPVSSAEQEEPASSTNQAETVAPTEPQKKNEEIKETIDSEEVNSADSNIPVENEAKDTENVSEEQGGTEARAANSDFNISPDGVLRKYNGTASEVVIPSNVTAIDIYAFHQKNTVVSVKIPESVTRIERGAFFYCENLKKVNLPEGITTIKEYTFEGCRNLEGITIPDGVKEIGELAFDESGIRNVNIPKSVQTIGRMAFKKCSRLKSITIATGALTELPYRIFDQCGEVEKVVLPKNLKNIGEGAFAYCERLAEITLPETVTEIGTRAFEATALKSIVLPDGITKLEKYTFAACPNLTDVTFPQNLKSIGYAAFAICPIERLTMRGDAPEISEKSPFNPTHEENILLKVPQNAKGYDREPWSLYKMEDDITMPGVVKNLRAVPAGLNQVQLTWDKAINAEGYLVYAQKEGKYGYCGMTGGTKYIDKKALDLKYNFYWVYPYIQNSSGKKIIGSCSQYVYARGMCADVSNLKAVSVLSGVKVTWNKSAGATGYLIYGKTATGAYGYKGMTTKNAEFIDKSASKKEYNFYWVYPYVQNSSGKKITGGCPKYVYAKGKNAAVTSLKAIAASGGVKVTWGKSPEAEGYLIYGKTATGAYGYKGMTTKNQEFIDKKASKKEYNFYWVYPYIKDSAGNRVVGTSPKYVYAKAR